AGCLHSRMGCIGSSPSVSPKSSWPFSREGGEGNVKAPTDRMARPRRLHRALCWPCTVKDLLQTVAQVPCPDLVRGRRLPFPRRLLVDPKALCRIPQHIEGAEGMDPRMTNGVLVHGDDKQRRDVPAGGRAGVLVQQGHGHGEGGRLQGGLDHEAERSPITPKIADPSGPHLLEQINELQVPLHGGSREACGQFVVTPFNQHRDSCTLKTWLSILYPNNCLYSCAHP